MLEFAHPWILLLLVVVPLTVWWYARWGRRAEGTVQFSSIRPLLQVPRLSGEWKVRLLMVLQLTIIALLITAMARPRAVLDLSETSVNVVDMVLVVDISSSMRAEDFKPNRLEAAKQTDEKIYRGSKRGPHRSARLCRRKLYPVSAHHRLRCPPRIAVSGYYYR